ASSATTASNEARDHFIGLSGLLQESKRPTVQKLEQRRPLLLALRLFDHLSILARSDQFVPTTDRSRRPCFGLAKSLACATSARLEGCGHPDDSARQYDVHGWVQVRSTVRQFRSLAAKRPEQSKPSHARPPRGNRAKACRPLRPAFA